jgi:hypothetical protein
MKRKEDFCLVVKSTSPVVFTTGEWEAAFSITVTSLKGIITFISIAT